MGSDNMFAYYICRQPDHKQAIALPSFDTQAVWEGLGAAIPIVYDGDKRLFSFYEWPGYIVSDRLMQILLHFCGNLEKRPIALVNTAAEFSALYWLCRFPQFSCKNPMIKLAVSVQWGENNEIFQIKKGMKTYCIVKAGLAEEIVKAGFPDIEFEGVCTDERV